MAQETPIIHPFAPVYDENSRILILGTFPSVKSREQGFYYGHPRNRFWAILAAYTGDDPGDTPMARRDFLLRHGIALYDVLASCRIRGSSDASIREAVPNDLSPILQTAQIGAILANGSTAVALYRRYQEPLTGISAILVPSTSPANASWSLEKLQTVWFAALDAAKNHP